MSYLIVLLNFNYISLHSFTAEQKLPFSSSISFCFVQFCLVLQVRINFTSSNRPPSDQPGFRFLSCRRRHCVIKTKSFDMWLT